jgi:hypothetical protein
MKKTSIRLVATGAALAATTAGFAANANAWSWSGNIGGGGDHFGPLGSWFWDSDVATGGGDYLVGFCSHRTGACSWATQEPANGTPEYKSVPSGYSLCYPVAVNLGGTTQHHDMHGS